MGAVGCGPVGCFLSVNPVTVLETVGRGFLRDSTLCLFLLQQALLGIRVQLVELLILVALAVVGGEKLLPSTIGKQHHQFFLTWVIRVVMMLDVYRVKQWLVLKYR